MPVRGSVTGEDTEDESVPDDAVFSDFPPVSPTELERLQAEHARFVSVNGVSGTGTPARDHPVGRIAVQIHVPEVKESFEEIALFMSAEHIEVRLAQAPPDESLVDLAFGMPVDPSTAVASFSRKKKLLRVSVSLSGGYYHGTSVDRRAAAVRIQRVHRGRQGRFRAKQRRATLESEKQEVYEAAATRLQKVERGRQARQMVGQEKSGGTPSSHKPQEQPVLPPSLEDQDARVLQRLGRVLAAKAEVARRRLARNRSRLRNPAPQPSVPEGVPELDPEEAAVRLQSFARRKEAEEELRRRQISGKRDSAPKRVPSARECMPSPLEELDAALLQRLGRVLIAKAEVARRRLARRGRAPKRPTPPPAAPEQLVDDRTLDPDEAARRIQKLTRKQQAESEVQRRKHQGSSHHAAAAPDVPSALEDYDAAVIQRLGRILIAKAEVARRRLARFGPRPRTPAPPLTSPLEEPESRQTRLDPFAEMCAESEDSVADVQIKQVAGRPEWTSFAVHRSPSPPRRPSTRTMAAAQMLPMDYGPPADPPHRRNSRRSMAVGVQLPATPPEAPLQRRDSRRSTAVGVQLPATPPGAPLQRRDSRRSTAVGVDLPGTPPEAALQRRDSRRTAAAQTSLPGTPTEQPLQRRYSRRSTAVAVGLPDTPSEQPLQRRMSRRTTAVGVVLPTTPTEASLQRRGSRRSTAVAVELPDSPADERLALERCVSRRTAAAAAVLPDSVAEEALGVERTLSGRTPTQPPLVPWGLDDADAAVIQRVGRILVAKAEVARRRIARRGRQPRVPAQPAAAVPSDPALAGVEEGQLVALQCFVRRRQAHKELERRQVARQQRPGPPRPAPPPQPVEDLELAEVAVAAVAMQRVARVFLARAEAARRRVRNRRHGAHEPCAVPEALEEVEAAVQIQALARQQSAKMELQRRHVGSTQKQPRKPMPRQSVMGLPPLPPEEAERDEAAARIQNAVRGKAAREEAERRRMHAAGTTVGTIQPKREPHPGSPVPPHTLEDQERSAAKLQGLGRRKAAEREADRRRRAQGRQPVPRSPSPGPVHAPSLEDAEDPAVRTLQRATRSYQALFETQRRRMSRRRGTWPRGRQPGPPAVAPPALDEEPVSSRTRGPEAASPLEPSPEPAPAASPERGGTAPRVGSPVQSPPQSPTLQPDNALSPVRSAVSTQAAMSPGSGRFGQPRGWAARASPPRPRSAPPKNTATQTQASSLGRSAPLDASVCSPPRSARLLSPYSVNGWRSPVLGRDVASPQTGSSYYSPNMAWEASPTSSPGAGGVRVSLDEQAGRGRVTRTEASERCALGRVLWLTVRELRRVEARELCDGAANPLFRRRPQSAPAQSPAPTAELEQAEDNDRHRVASLEDCEREAVILQRPNARACSAARRRPLARPMSARVPPRAEPWEQLARPLSWVRGSGEADGAVDATVAAEVSSRTALLARERSNRDRLALRCGAGFGRVLGSAQRRYGAGRRPVAASESPPAAALDGVLWQQVSGAEERRRGAHEVKEQEMRNRLAKRALVASNALQRTAARADRHR